MEFETFSLFQQIKSLKYGKDSQNFNFGTYLDFNESES